MAPLLLDVPCRNPAQGVAPQQARRSCRSVWSAADRYLIRRVRRATIGLRPVASQPKT